MDVDTVEFVSVNTCDGPGILNFMVFCKTYDFVFFLVLSDVDTFGKNIV